MSRSQFRRKCYAATGRFYAVWYLTEGHGGGNKEPEKLANCYKNSLRLVVQYNLHSVAFPNISTGVYGYPKPHAAEVAVRTVTQFLKDNSLELDVHFVCFDEENYQLYRSLMK